MSDSLPSGSSSVPPPPTGAGSSALCYSLLAHVVTRVLDRLPYPWGEDIMAVLGLAHAVFHPTKLWRVRAWARAQPGGASRRHRLALSLFAHYGRFIAQDALVGVRTADDLRRHLRVEGTEHLAAARGPRGVILLGFHVGPPGVWLGLQLAGHRVTFFGDACHHRRWLRTASRASVDPSRYVAIDGSGPEGRLRALSRAERLLLQGETVYIGADGPYGRPAFSLDLPGGSLRVRSGWLALQRSTAARTLPVLAHQDGRQRVIVIHPPLPPVQPSAALDAAICRDALTLLLAEYLRRVPEQCFGLVLRTW